MFVVFSVLFCFVSFFFLFVFVFVLFCFCFVLFCFVLFCFVLFCLVWFGLVWFFDFVLFCFRSLQNAEESNLGYLSNLFKKNSWGIIFWVRSQSQRVRGWMKPGNIKNHYFEKCLLSMVLKFTVYVATSFSPFTSKTPCEILIFNIFWRKIQLFYISL